jgi:hypothetical protein
LHYCNSLIKFNYDVHIKYLIHTNMFLIIFFNSILWT